jgi:hypothetical protein
MFALITLLICWLAQPSNEVVFYRSKTVPFEALVKQSGGFTLTNDAGEAVGIDLLVNQKNSQIYWYRRLFTEVCLTGECRPIDIGIYWTASGKYLGVEIFGENLTKTDHSDFSNFDYLKLESVLNDEWSPLREFEFEELVEEKKEGVDATTGATKKVIADASVKDAVYTTYTMWHLIHVGEGEQLALLSYRYLDAHDDLFAASLQAKHPDYYAFLIGGVASGNFPAKKDLIPILLKSLSQHDASLKNSAFKAIGRLPLDEPAVQDEIARAYPLWAMPDKNRFLQSATGLTQLSHHLYEALSSDLTQQNPWFLSSLLTVLAKRHPQSPDVLAKVKDLSISGNTLLEEAATKFLRTVR